MTAERELYRELREVKKMKAQIQLEHDENIEQRHALMEQHQENQRLGRENSRLERELQVGWRVGLLLHAC
jgi:hypothetical protein